MTAFSTAEFPRSERVSSNCLQSIQLPFGILVLLGTPKAQLPDLHEAPVFDRSICL
jgi:hypothetical protein